MTGGTKHDDGKNRWDILPDVALEAFTAFGGSVYEPFAGSGTTLIACENLGRRCFAMEIDPVYCDVIVDRWERHTGREATLEAPGS